MRGDRQKACRSRQMRNTCHQIGSGQHQSGDGPAARHLVHYVDFEFAFILPVPIMGPFGMDMDHHQARCVGAILEP